MYCAPVKRCRSPCTRQSSATHTGVINLSVSGVEEGVSVVSDIGQFFLKPGQNQTCPDLLPGLYTIHNIPSHARIKVTGTDDIKRDGNNLILRLRSFQKIGCHLEYTKMCALRVSLTVLGPDDSFTFVLNNNEIFTITTENGFGEQTIPNLTGGKHNLEQLLPEGWFSKNVRGTISTRQGQTKIVSVSNQKGGRIILRPKGKSHTASYKVSWSDEVITVSSENSHISQYLLPGQYTIKQVLPAGWVTSNVTCSGVHHQQDDEIVVTVESATNSIVSFSNISAPITRSVRKEIVIMDGQVTVEEIPVDEPSATPSALEKSQEITPTAPEESEQTEEVTPSAPEESEQDEEEITPSAPEETTVLTPSAPEESDECETITPSAPEESEQTEQVTPSAPEQSEETTVLTPSAPEQSEQTEEEITPTAPEESEEERSTDTHELTPLPAEPDTNSAILTGDLSDLEEEPDHQTGYIALSSTEPNFNYTVDGVLYAAGATIPVDSGLVEIVQEPRAGYELTEIICDKGTSDCQAGKVVVNVGTGETVKCKFVNRAIRPQSISISGDTLFCNQDAINTTNYYLINDQTLTIDPADKDTYSFSLQTYVNPGNSVGVVISFVDNMPYFFGQTCSNPSKGSMISYEDRIVTGSTGRKWLLSGSYLPIDAGNIVGVGYSPITFTLQL